MYSCCNCVFKLILIKFFSTKQSSWFGHHHESKNIKNPIPFTLLEKKANHAREIESALERERAKNKTLLEQIAQTNVELLKCKKERKIRSDYWRF